MDEQREAEIYFSRLQIPVSFFIGQYDYTAKYSHATTHIIVKETLQDRRLYRSAHQSLCLSKSNVQGADWTHTERIGADGRVYAPQPTCLSCKRIAQRWKGMAKSVTHKAEKPIGKPQDTKPTVSKKSLSKKKSNTPSESVQKFTSVQAAINHAARHHYKRGTYKIMPAKSGGAVILRV